MRPERRRGILAGCARRSSGRPVECPGGFCTRAGDTRVGGHLTGHEPSPAALTSGAGRSRCACAARPAVRCAR
jgi:hypothetical protein